MATTIPAPLRATEALRQRAELPGGGARQAEAQPTGGPADPSTIRSAFEGWDYKDAAAVVAAAVERMPGGKVAYDTIAKILRRDYWDNGRGWGGPGGGDAITSPEVRDVILRAVQPKFTPVDVSNEILDRVVSGLLEREGAVRFAPMAPAGTDGKPTDAQVAEADAVLGLVQTWWDRVDLWGVGRLCTARSRAFTRGLGRLHVVPGDLITADVVTDPAEDGGDPLVETVTGLPADLTPAEAFARVRLDAPEPNVAALYRDPVTCQVAAVYLFQDTPDGTRPGQTASARNRAEVWFQSPDEPTVALVRVLSEQGAAEVYGLETGGQLPLAELEADLLLTEVLRAQQKALNFENTVTVRTVEAAGFPERYTTNAGPNGLWLSTKPEGGPALAERTDGDGKKWYLHAVPREMGAAILTELRGFEYESGVDALGRPSKAITTPGVERFDPVDPGFAIKGVEHMRAMILEGAHQGHVLADATAAAISGYSRQQARDDHLKDLNALRPKLERFLVAMIRGAIGMAAGMTREGAQPITDGGAQVDLRTFLARYTVQVQVHVNAGPITPAEQAENAKQVAAGLLPQEDALLRNGVEDVQRALALIRADPMYLATLWAKRGEALANLVKAGADLVGAAELLGVDPKDAAKLIPTDNGTGNPALNGGVVQ